jgi:BirA family biotin operon repressor/biotin-[acetyl-CoA-carboxylase] ligase
MPNLTKQTIQKLAKDRTICKEAVFFPTIESTNSYGLRLLKRQPQHNTLIVADYQSGGRGREQRRWLAPAGKALLFSFALALPERYSGLQFLTLLGAASVADVMREHFKLDAKIKWPNDVVVIGKKICGALTEVIPLGNLKKGVVLGIGVNVNQQRNDFQPDIRQKATSIMIQTGIETDRLDLLARIIDSMDEYYAEFLRDEREHILSRCKHLSSTLGRAVRMHTHQGLIEGTAQAIEDDGGLVVRRDTGITTKIYSGDVEEIEWLK